MVYRTKVDRPVLYPRRLLFILENEETTVLTIRSKSTKETGTSEDLLTLNDYDDPSRKCTHLFIDWYMYLIIY